MRALQLFPKTRLPNTGVVLDMEYEKVMGETFYRLKIEDDCYAGRGELCVLFSAFPTAPQDCGAGCAGKIVIIGFCWWSQELS
ncbi:MAG: hypothetical protein PVI86_17350, partial [Phycisphaerae bacterium]